MWAHNTDNKFKLENYLESIATFTFRRQIVIYPERFYWADVNETIFDLMMDDDSWDG